jgi:hypothetical protein
LVHSGRILKCSGGSSAVPHLRLTTG